jgi:hypothetical protein
MHACRITSARLRRVFACHRSPVRTCTAAPT